ncbi:MAG: hypothetical protein A3J67_01395 [Parcubacteria group bacterium RIFCSPHIGHO2_02_FULL_48_10b]|nr:MAG: hypothetical protein A3J67_01395 [Parcubacteria group bacterium RIFCSPHIGHO2_02_FULL_48_10b]
MCEVATNQHTGGPVGVTRILALVGEKGSGKGEFVTYAAETFFKAEEPLAVTWKRTTRNIPREICRILYVREEPEFLQKLPLGLQIVFDFVPPLKVFDRKSDIQEVSWEDAIARQQWPAKRLAHIRFSDPLREITDLMGMPHDTRYLQRLPQMLQIIFGSNVLSRAVVSRARDCRADKVILDGVRWPHDETAVRFLRDSQLIYITAKMEIRYARRKNRGENVEEHDMPFEEFLRQEQEQSEVYIPFIGSRVDGKNRIDNNGALEEFYKEARRVLEASCRE